MTLVAISLLVGMVLGQRFKVLVLVPISAVALIIAVGVGTAQGNSLPLIAIISAAAISSLQIGYLVGISLRHLMVIARASRPRTGPLPIPVRRTVA
jgi:hypothetical protein